MGQYRKGTATFTNGDATVTFTGGTELLANVDVGDLIKPDGLRTFAEVGSITNDAELELVSAWTGDSVTTTYIIQTDFTPNLALPYPTPGDSDTQDVIKKALLIIDTALSGGGDPLYLPDGTAALPGLAFGSDKDNGIYRIGANNWGLVVGGVKLWDFSSALAALTGTLTASGPVIGCATTYGTFATPAVCAGDTNYGMYVSGGNLYFKSASAGHVYFRNKLDTNNVLDVDGDAQVVNTARISAAVPSGTAATFTNSSANQSVNVAVTAGTNSHAYHTISRSAVNYDAQQLWAPSGTLSSSNPVWGAGFSFNDSGNNWKLTTYDGSSTVDRLVVTPAGHLLPGADNAQNFGSASAGWQELFCDNGTINTSDQRKKTTVTPLSAQELSAARDLAREIGSFQFLAAVAVKGEGARVHIGMTVQRAIEILQSHGLEPFRYSFICHDEWQDEFIDHPAVAAADAVESAPAEYEEASREMAVIINGRRVPVQQPYLREIKAAVEARPAIVAAPAWREQTKAAGDRYGFRVHELLLFIARGFEARLTALES